MIGPLDPVGSIEEVGSQGSGYFARSLGKEDEISYYTCEHLDTWFLESSYPPPVRDSRGRSIPPMM